jgi:hypothetical protein
MKNIVQKNLSIFEKGFCDPNSECDANDQVTGISDKNVIHKKVVKG